MATFSSKMNELTTRQSNLEVGRTWGEARMNQLESYPHSNTMTGTHLHYLK